jgi:hypothetical protein
MFVKHPSPAMRLVPEEVLEYFTDFDVEGVTPPVSTNPRIAKKVSRVFGSWSRGCHYLGYLTHQDLRGQWSAKRVERLVRLLFSGKHPHPAGLENPILAAAAQIHCESLDKVVAQVKREMKGGLVA